MPTRRTFFGASALALSAARLVAAGAPAVAASAPYDFAAIEAWLMLPFRHRQAFGSHALADGAAAGFMLNSLNAYEFDYGDGPGMLHALGFFTAPASHSHRRPARAQRRGDRLDRSWLPAEHEGFDVVERSNPRVSAAKREPA